MATGRSSAAPLAWQMDDDDDEITIERRVRVVPAARAAFLSEAPRSKRPLLRRMPKAEQDDDFIEVRDSWLLPGPL